MFNQKVTTRVVAKKANILSLFTRTLDDLRALNDMAVGEINRQTNVASEAMEEVKELQGVVESNNKTIEQIDKFLA